MVRKGMLNINHQQVEGIGTSSYLLWLFSLVLSLPLWLAFPSRVFEIIEHKMEDQYDDYINIFSLSD